MMFSWFSWLCLMFFVFFFSGLSILQLLSPLPTLSGEFAASPHAHLLDVLGDRQKQLPAPFNAKWCGASSAHTMLLCLCFRTWNYWSFLILLTVTSFAWWSCWKNAKLWSQTPLLVSHLRCPAPRLCLVSAQAQQMWAKESEFRAFLQSTGTHFAHGLIGEKICCQTGSLEPCIDKLRSIGIWGKGCWITSWFDSAQAPQLWFRHSRQGPDHGRLQAVSGLDAGRLGPNEGHRTLIIFVFHTKDLDKWGAFIPVAISTLELVNLCIV